MRALQKDLQVWGPTLCGPGPDLPYRPLQVDAAPFGSTLDGVTVRSLLDLFAASTYGNWSTPLKTNIADHDDPDDGDDKVQFRDLGFFWFMDTVQEMYVVFSFCFFSHLVHGFTFFFF